MVRNAVIQELEKREAPNTTRAPELQKFPLRYRLLLVTLPFLFPAWLWIEGWSVVIGTEYGSLRPGFRDRLLFVLAPHWLLLSHYRAKNQKKNWHSFWLYYCLGILLWTVLVILWARVVMNSHK